MAKKRYYQSGVDHLPKGLNLAADCWVQPAGIGVEEDNGAETTKLTFFLKDQNYFIRASTIA